MRIIEKPSLQTTYLENLDLINLDPFLMEAERLLKKKKILD